MKSINHCAEKLVRYPYRIETAATVLLNSLVSVPAHAQSSVTLYGSIDEGVGYVTNEKGHSATVTGPISVPDQFGFKGGEDLGGGLKAIFQLENGFFSNTGALATSGVLFSRKAFVGLSDDTWGTLTPCGYIQVDVRRGIAKQSEGGC
ncbi:porin [Burkholderia sp. R-69980]|nr:porin [Burkholderia sp. R-69980]